MNMKSRLFAVLMAFVLIVGMLPAQTAEALTPGTFLYGVDYDQDGAVRVKKGGNGDDFAADAPIATVRLDRSKLTKDNVKLTASGNQNVQDGYELDANGEIWAKGCAINADYKNIGGFTLAFANAALLPDGTEKTLEIVFDQITVIRKSGAEPYEDDICIAKIAGNTVSFSPLTKEQRHMALRAEVTYRVKDAGDEDVFLFDARGINNVRKSQNFASIENASAHYNYSESMEPTSGVVAGSHLYLPADSALRVETGNSSPTLGHRFIGKSEPDTAKYTFVLPPRRRRRPAFRAAFGAAPAPIAFRWRCSS